MAKSKELLQLLLQNYFNGTIDTEKEEELWNFLSDPAYEQELLDILPDVFDKNMPVPADRLQPLQRKQLLHHIFSGQLETTIVKKRRLWSQIAVAATITVIFSLSLFYINEKEDLNTIVGTEHIHAGKNGATLVLANGKNIILSEEMNGKLAEEDNTLITKTADGSIMYTVIARTSKSNSKNIVEGDNEVSNTLTTAKGETYKIVLPDQSEVWLNAASSLKYPSSFVNKKNAPRTVELFGEAYFEIKKDKTHPFIVKTINQEVKVLGTQFNINAYQDEEHVKTTLVEGSVYVKGLNGNTEDGKGFVLKPDQQSILTGNKMIVKNVDASDAVAWKEGYFMFNSEGLGSIMNRIARWYNVNVVFEDTSLRSRTFFGSISKFEKISKVLNVLKRTGVATFTVEGNTVIVKQK